MQTGSYTGVAPKRIQFVVKISKLCNLRCRYCYEFEELGDTYRVPLDNLERMYRNVEGWYKKLEPATQLEFVWHGGEPLLVPPDVYWSTFETQKRVFGDVRVRNTVQTNLTKLDDKRLKLLKDGFDGVGVSVDLFGELRINAAGKDSLPKTLKNMDWLQEEGLDYGAITVLSQANVGNIKKIIGFFHQLGVSSLRLLPLFDGANSDQHQGYEIGHEEVLEAMKVAFEELVKLDSPMRVEPIHRYVNQCLCYFSPEAQPRYYNKRDWQPVLVVNTDGNLYGYGESEPEFAHGNLFENPMEDCLLSPGHLAACVKSERRMKACHECKFFGACDGEPLAESAGRHKGTLGDGKVECVVEKGMLEYLETRLNELGVINPVTKQVRIPSPGTALSHLDTLPLQPGIRIHFDVPGATDDRVLLSSGTTNDTEMPHDGLRYLDVALVPKMPWRSPSAAEQRMLLSNGVPQEWTIGSDIGVVRIPDGIMENFEQIFESFGTREKLDKKRYRNHTEHPAWDMAYQELTEFVLTRYSIRQHSPLVVRLASAHPGLTTVTKDEVIGHEELFYVGLHLDTWEKIPMNKRAQARNRICINMGREARQFLLVNLTMAQIFQLLKPGSDPATISDYYGNDLCLEFMRAFPGYPVTKVTIGPREAYIAPTDNMIHDATSIGKENPDIALHIVGYFGLSPGVTAAVGELQQRERLEY